MRWIVAVAALALAAGCAATPESPPHDPPGLPALHSGAWVKLSSTPLSPRTGPAVAAIGDDLVVVGGYTGPPCPPNADCAYPQDAAAADGAALNLTTGQWRHITDAPRPVPEHVAYTVVDKQLYVVVDQALLTYDPAADAWATIQPPHPFAAAALATDGHRLITVSGTDENGVVPDYAYNTRTRRWSTLPADPFKPAFDRSLTPTSAGLVVTAKPLNPDGSLQDPALVHAAVLTNAGTWRVLPPSEQLGGGQWTWTGDRMVDATLGGADGGEVNNYGRTLPFGGRLDPATGEWSPLPDAPEERGGGWPVTAPGGPVIASQGWLYDDRDASWTKLPEPDDAPAQPGTAIWVNGILVVVGGLNYPGGDEPGGWTAKNVYATGVWAYRPQ